MQYLHFLCYTRVNINFSGSWGAAALKTTLNILSRPSGRTTSF